MRRLLLAFLLLCPLLIPARAGAASNAYDVPELVAGGLKAVKRVTEVPVLLPSRLSSEFTKLYSAGRGRAGSYEFELSPRRNCGGATACFLAGFYAVRGKRPTARRKVALAGGITGYFRPLSCGASCAAPSIEWSHGGVLYTIQAKLGTRRTERAILTRLANSAIRNGPR